MRINFTSFPAAADCTGASYLDQITADQRAALDATVAGMPYATGLVWEANKGPDKVTVVGTMHIYDPRLEALRSRLAETVANADLVMLEATPEEEAALQARYAAIPDLGDRAYQILLDLGMFDEERFG